MTEKKHTKRDLFQTLLVLASATEADEWVIKGIQHELELLDRKHNSKSEDTKRKAEQNVLKSALGRALNPSEGQTATELGNAVGCSVQRASALLRQLVAEGVAVRNEKGKAVTFTLAD